MTVVALLAEPPLEGRVFEDLVAADVCSESAAADLYAAAVQDAMTAVARSGGDLLVHYPPAEELPGDGDPEGQLRTLADVALSEVDGADPDDVRFEVQVGSTESARIGNAITHLLEGEGATSAAVLRPTAPLVDRTLIDGAAMKLRRDPVVLGPGTGGRVYYAGFAEPIDFEDAVESPAVATLARRARDADLDVAFERPLPLLDDVRDYETNRAILEARSVAGRPGALATTGVLSDR